MQAKELPEESMPGGAEHDLFALQRQPESQILDF